MDDAIKKYLSEIGKKGGMARSGRKSKTATENGKLGGRPRYAELESARAALLAEVDGKYADLMDGMEEAHQTVRERYAHLIRNSFNETRFWLREMRKKYTKNDLPRFKRLSELIVKADEILLKYTKAIVWDRYEHARADADIYAPPDIYTDEECFSDNTRFVIDRLIVNALLKFERRGADETIDVIEDEKIFIERFWRLAETEKPEIDCEVEEWSTIEDPDIEKELEEIASGKYDNMKSMAFFKNRKLGDLSDLAKLLLESNVKTIGYKKVVDI